MGAITRRGLGCAVSATALTAVVQARADVARSEQPILAGTRWETPCLTVDSGRDGLVVLIVAGIHGNEPAPPLAARALAALTPTRGRIVVVPEANRPALARRTRHTPGVKHTDLNRNFPQRAQDPPAARGELAGALWDLTVALAPDWVLDLHEGWGYAKSSTSMGSSVVHAPHPEGAHDVRPVADLLVATVNDTIADARKAFTVIGPGPNGSFARAVVSILGTPALVLETTWVEEMDTRVAQQRLLATTLLSHVGVL